MPCFESQFVHSSQCLRTRFFFWLLSGAGRFRGTGCWGTPPKGGRAVWMAMGGWTGICAATAAVNPLNVSYGFPSKGGGS